MRALQHTLLRVHYLSFVETIPHDSKRKRKSNSKSQSKTTTLTQPALNDPRNAHCVSVLTFDQQLHHIFPWAFMVVSPEMSMSVVSMPSFRYTA